MSLPSTPSRRRVLGESILHSPNRRLQYEPKASACGDNYSTGNYLSDGEDYDLDSDTELDETPTSGPTLPKFTGVIDEQFLRDHEAAQKAHEDELRAIDREQGWDQLPPPPTSHGMSQEHIDMVHSIDHTARPTKDVLVMSLRALDTSGICELVKGTALRMIQIFDAENVLLHPDGPWSQAAIDGLAVKALEYKTGMGYVYMMGNKIGSSTALDKRRDTYARKQFGLSPSDPVSADMREAVPLQPLISVDHVFDMETDLQLKDCMTTLLRSIIHDERFPYPQRIFWHIVLERGLGNLGIFRSLGLQLAEIACQVKFNRTEGRMMEAFACDMDCLEKRRAWVLKATNSLWKKIQSGRRKGNFEGIYSVNVWPTGQEKQQVKSKIAVTNAISGCRHVNTIDHAAVPNAKTNQEIFDTSNYTAKDRDSGFEKYTALIQYAANPKCPWVMSVDSNKMVLKHSRENRIEHFQAACFEIVDSAFGGELLLLEHTATGGIIIGHFPFCQCGASEEFKDRQLIILRNMGAAVVQQISFCLPNVAPEQDPLLAAAVRRSNLHGCHRPKEYPLLLKARREYRRQQKNIARKERPLDASIIDGALKILSRESSNSLGRGVFQKIQAHFAQGNTEVSKRWGALYARLQKAGTETALQALKELKAIRDSTMRRNLGTRTDKFGTNLSQTDLNHTDLNSKFPLILETGYVWCRAGQKTATSNLDDFPDFQDGIPAIRLGFAGIQTKFDKLNEYQKLKGNTSKNERPIDIPEGYGRKFIWGIRGKNKSTMYKEYKGEKWMRAELGSRETGTMIPLGGGGASRTTSATSAASSKKRASVTSVVSQRQSGTKKVKQATLGAFFANK